METKRLEGITCILFSRILFKEIVLQGNPDEMDQFSLIPFGCTI